MGPLFLASISKHNTWHLLLTQVHLSRVIALTHNQACRRASHSMLVVRRSSPGCINLGCCIPRIGIRCHAHAMHQRMNSCSLQGITRDP